VKRFSSRASALASLTRLSWKGVSFLTETRVGLDRGGVKVVVRWSRNSLIVSSEQLDRNVPYGGIWEGTVVVGGSEPLRMAGAEAAGPSVVRGSGGRGVAVTRR
jgi:hypothetical protein